MKNKNVITVLSFCLLFLGGVLWQVHQYLSSESIHQADKQGQAHISSVMSSVQIEMKSFLKTSGYFMSQTLSSDKVNWSQMNPVLGMIKLDLKNSKWHLSEMALNDKVLDPALQTVAALEKKIESLKIPTQSVSTEQRDFKENFFYFSKFESNPKNPLLSVALISGDKAFLFITSADLFQGILDSFKNDTVTLALATEAGIAMAHSKAEYIGTSVSDNPLWNEIESTKSNEGSGTYQLDGSPAVLGNFSKIDKTNLYGMMTRPMSALKEGTTKFIWQFLFLGLGVLLVFVGLMVKLINSEKNDEERTLKAMKPGTGAKIDQSLLLGAEPVAEEKKVLEVIKNIKPEEFKNESDQNKMEIYKKVAVAVGHEIQAPLNSILGYCQMVLSSAPDRNIEGNIESILRETRSAKNVMEKLFAFSGEISAEKFKVNLNSSIEKVLKKMAPKFETKNIKIEKNLTSHSEIMLNQDSMIKVIENVLENSMEAMERMSQKIIRIKTYETEDKLFLEIEDQGEGIATTEMGKVFDPFYTTKSYANHMGMGLPVAVGILKDHQASLQISSDKGKGTKVTIEFQKKMKVPEFAKKSNIQTQIENDFKNSVVEDVDKTFLIDANDFSGTAQFEKTLLISDDSDIDELLDLPPTQSNFITNQHSEEFNIAQVEKKEVQLKARPVVRSEKINLDEYKVEIRRPGERL